MGGALPISQQNAPDGQLYDGDIKRDENNYPKNQKCYFSECVHVRLRRVDPRK